MTSDTSDSPSAEVHAPNQRQASLAPGAKPGGQLHTAQPLNDSRRATGLNTACLSQQPPHCRQSRPPRPLAQQHLAPSAPSGKQLTMVLSKGGRNPGEPSSLAHPHTLHCSPRVAQQSLGLLSQRVRTWGCPGLAEQRGDTGAPAAGGFGFLGTPCPGSQGNATGLFCRAASTFRKLFHPLKRTP